MKFRFTLNPRGTPMNIKKIKQDVDASRQIKWLDQTTAIYKKR